MDSLAALLTGGDTGPAIVVGQAEDSLLVKAIQRGEDLAMPPETPLAQPEIDALTRWINDGANWPEGLKQLDSLQDTSWKQHWAFQQLQRPAVPEIDSDWIQTPIDAFVL